MKVCLIRSGPAQGAHLLPLLQARCDLLDACHPQHVRIERVELAGTVSAAVRGVPLAAFDRIFFLGVPVPMLPSEHDLLYAYEESHAALLSALRAFAERVVNARVVLQTSGLLRTSPHFVHLLSRVGWATAGVAYRYDFAAGQVDKLVKPAAADADRRLLVCTQRSWRLVPDEAGARELLRAEVAATQQWMAHEQLDMLGLSIARDGDRHVVHGARVNPEVLFEMPEVADMMSDVLC